MNYRSQLRGWGIDRAIELAKINNSKENPITLEEIISNSAKFALHAYIPGEDAEKTADYLLDVLENTAPGEVDIHSIISRLESVAKQHAALVAPIKMQ